MSMKKQVRYRLLAAVAPLTLFFTATALAEGEQIADADKLLACDSFIANINFTFHE